MNNEVKIAKEDIEDLRIKFSELLELSNGIALKLEEIQNKSNDDVEIKENNIIDEWR